VLTIAFTPRKKEMQNISPALEYGGFKIHLGYLEFHLLSQKNRASFSFRCVHDLWGSNYCMQWKGYWNPNESLL